MGSVKAEVNWEGERQGEGRGILMLAVWPLTSSVSLSSSSAWDSSWRAARSGVARAEAARERRAKKDVFILAEVDLRSSVRSRDVV